MAKQIPRNEADNEPTTSAPPARPKKASSRRRTARETAGPARPSSSPDVSHDQPAESPADSPAESMGSGTRVSPVDAVNSDPSQEDIRVRAYLRYLERGAGHGLEFDDWVEAERELRTRNHEPTTED